MLQLGKLISFPRKVIIMIYFYCSNCKSEGRIFHLTQDLYLQFLAICFGVAEYRVLSHLLVTRPECPVVSKYCFFAVLELAFHLLYKDLK